MTIDKTNPLKRFIPKYFFETCLLDGFSRNEICEMYSHQQVSTKRNVYYLEKLIFHLKSKFNLTFIEYCEKYLDEPWPVCPVNGKKVGVRLTSVPTFYNFSTSLTKDFPQVKAYCDKFSKDRKGTGNPMFGVKSWNQGLKKEDDERLMAVSRKMTGRKVSEETRRKQSESAKKRLVHGHTGYRHTQKLKDEMRIHTAKLWSSGAFNKTTSIHIKMREFLSTLNLASKVEEEYQVKYYSLDFALPDVKVGIETDGDYFHSNPAFYPDGPKTATQRRNAGRDKSKNKYLEEKGWTILRFWECDINAGSYKEKLICKLKELNLLKESESERQSTSK